jgi:hypothetical protein
MVDRTDPREDRHLSRLRRLAWQSRGCRTAALLAATIALTAPASCTAAGHGSAPTTTPSAAGPPPSVTPSTTPTPAALAGGACLLLDFKTVAEQLGTTFTVSAAADTSGTFSCVLQGSAGSYPRLTLSITATELSPADFIADVKPKGSTSVAELGKTAYEAQVDATKSAGPVIEIGWLSGNDRLIIFRYAFPTGTSAAVSKALVPKMVSLAKIVDQTTV